MIVNNETGEVFEEATENQLVANTESNNLPTLDRWLELQEQLLTVKQQFEMVDKKLREEAKPLFRKYQVKYLDNPYLRITLKNGYERKTLDSAKVERYLISQGLDINDFKTKKWFDDSIVIKYKDGKE